MYPGRPGAKSPSANGPPNNKPQVVSDQQAREKLAVYVYEYLVHVGAKSAAQTFLSEIRWEKSIALGEPPGFLHSWWCVFWDLYCAAPERRDHNDHSGEAKAFHDYSAHSQPPQPPIQEPHPAFHQFYPGTPVGLPPFGAHGVRPRVPIPQPPTGQPIFPHGPIDQYRLMRPVAPGLPGVGDPGVSLPPSASSPLPLPPGGSLSGEMTQPISASPSHASGPPPSQPDSGLNSNESGGGIGGTPGEFGGNQSLPNPDGAHSFVIQKIKESMQEEAKRFTGDPEQNKQLQTIDADENQTKRDFY